jgi:hypothetical protein
MLDISPPKKLCISVNSPTQGLHRTWKTGTPFVWRQIYHIESKVREELWSYTRFPPASEELQGT